MTGWAANPTSPPTREKRLEAVSAYYGHADGLPSEWANGTAVNRIRTFSQSGYDDVMRALSLAAAIPGAAAVVHGPRGCAASQLHHTIYSAFGESLSWAVTNLSERDTILGGETKLRETLLRIVQRHRPFAVFVIAVSAVAINNDDIRSVTEELSEEWDIPILTVHTDSFRSAVSHTGWDTALAAAAVLADPRGEKVERGPEATINLLAVGEPADDIRELARLAEAIGLRARPFPLFAERDSWKAVQYASASIAADPDTGETLGHVWEKVVGVPYVETVHPIGLKGTTEWLLALGNAAGAHDAAKQAAASEEAEARQKLEPYRLDGINVYVSLPGSAALAVAELVEELGGTVAGLTIGHADRLQQGALQRRSELTPELRLLVGDGQPFEEANVLERLKPDLYIGGAGQAAWAAKKGIAVVSTGRSGFRGYRGAVELAKNASYALRNRALPELLAQRSGLPYTPGWYTKQPQWYIKQEVR